LELAPVDGCWTGQNDIEAFYGRLRSPAHAKINSALMISDALPFGRLWYTKPDDAIGYAQFYSRSHDAVIRVYDAARNVIETNEHAGEFKERLALRVKQKAATRRSMTADYSCAF
jgi:hypothetical protein